MRRDLIFRIGRISTRWLQKSLPYPRRAGPNAKLRVKSFLFGQSKKPTRIRSRPHVGAPARMSWARLLKPVFDIDIEHRPN